MESSVCYHVNSLQIFASNEGERLGLKIRDKSEQSRIDRGRRGADRLFAKDTREDSSGMNKKTIRSTVIASLKRDID